MIGAGERDGCEVLYKAVNLAVTRVGKTLKDEILQGACIVDVVQSVLKIIILLVVSSKCSSGGGG